MKNIAALSALVVLSASVAAGHLALGRDTHVARAAQPAIDDPPPEPVECPLCGGNPTLHKKRMQLIQALEAEFISAALRW